MMKAISFLILCLVASLEHPIQPHADINASGLFKPVFLDVSETHLPTIVLANKNSMDAETADIDGDGDLDIVLAIEFYKNVILINDGKGKFSDGSHLLPDKEMLVQDFPYSYYPYHDSEDVAIEDFDHNGGLDIIVVTEDDETNEYYVKSEDGNYMDVSATFPVKGITNGVITADFDNDGWMDVVMANNGQDEYLRNNYGNLLAETARRLPQSEDITQDIEAVDVDGDGRLDMIVANENDNKIYINDGKGYFRDETAKRFAGMEVRESREVDAGDVDGDGDLDLLFSNVLLFQKHEVRPQLMINDGNGYFTDQAEVRFPLEINAGYVDSDFVDIDKDGDLDVIMGGLDGFTVMINNGEGYFEDKTLELIGIKYKQMIIDVEAADFNNDGLLDIYMGTFRTGDILLLGQKQ